MTKLYPTPKAPSPEIRRDRKLIALAIPAIALLLVAIALYLFPFRKDAELLHISYDASREYYAALNQAYSLSLETPEQTLVIMNHAGSVRQASNLAHLQIADVVSLASAYDLQNVINRNEIAHPDWQSQLPFDSAPFHSTISLVVRKGNPKQLHNWSDLWRSDAKLALPSPGESGAGRWAFLALQTAATDPNQSPISANQKLQELYLRTTPINAGARAALTVFANRRDLDALLTWESDALQLQALGFEQLEAIHLPRSILASPRIATLSRYTEKRETTQSAKNYLAFQFSERGQRIAAENHLRPSDPHIAKIYLNRFPPTDLYTIPDEAWQNAFSPSGLYERLEKLRFAQHGGRE